MTEQRHDTAPTVGERQRSWLESITALKHPRVISMLFLGFSAGIPILLIFSSLSIWLREAGVERSEITYFSWAALGYSFKFVWAPLIDQLPLPWLTRLLGRRRGWLLLAQFAVIAAILMMAGVDPASDDQALVMLAVGATMLGFSSATQDIVIDAFRIEAADTRLQSLLSSAYIAGYRVAMVVSGAGALVLATWFGTSVDAYHYDAWRWTYGVMAAVMLVGVVTTLCVSEPEYSRERQYPHQVHTYVRFVALFAFMVTAFVLTYRVTDVPAQRLYEALAALSSNGVLIGLIGESLRLLLALIAGACTAYLLLQLRLVQRELVSETYIDPVRDFFSRYGTRCALLLLCLVGSYRISDIVLGVISNVFYTDMGFSKDEIAAAVKTFGVLMAIMGGLLGGVLAMRFGVLRMLFVGAVLSAATNLLFLLLAQQGHEIVLLYLIVAADNLSAGLAGAAFVAFLSSLTSISFTAMQYAIFSSLMTLLPKVLGGYSGGLVDAFGYSQFFILTTLLGMPVLLLIWLAGRWLDVSETECGQEVEKSRNSAVERV